ncbi:MAG: hypothetical protein FWB96_07025 [Defluviitaleaceae bacterium]|nr:hypothetical protein [Defluviitaleaceae bacterium]MCL2262979.1 hypothetical protein [Defluviitaleaceae bacterium]
MDNGLLQLFEERRKHDKESNFLNTLVELRVTLKEKFAALKTEDTINNQRGDYSYGLRTAKYKYAEDVAKWSVHCTESIEFYLNIDLPSHYAEATAAAKEWQACIKELSMLAEFVANF